MSTDDAMQRHNRKSRPLLKYRLAVRMEALFVSAAEQSMGQDQAMPLLIHQPWIFRKNGRDRASRK